MVYSLGQGKEWGYFFFLGGGGVAKISNIFGVLDIPDIFFWGGDER